MPQQQVPPREVMTTFNELANPIKQRTGPAASIPQYGDEDEEEEVAEEENGDEEEDGDEEDDDGADEEEEMVGDYPAAADASAQEQHDPLRPSEGFRTLDDEKADILAKLNRLRRQGMKGMRAFGVHSDIREMRAELNRIRTEIDMEASVKFQRKMLMAMTSGMEFLNKRYDPFDLQLDGWSEQVMESITDYDRVFERLHAKYKGKISAPPEIELVLMVGSSAFMFHLTNTMFKKNGGSLMENPEFMQSMAKAMAEQATAKQERQEQQQQQQDEQEDDEEEEDVEDIGRGGRREIRGPGMDMSSFLGGGGIPGFPGFLPPPMDPRRAPPPPPVRPPGPARKPTVPAPPMSDSGSSSSSGSGRSGRRKSGGASDRLSDVVSEDLISLPDDLSSVDDPDESVRVSMPAGKQRKGTGKKATAAAGPSKTVVLM